jgi:hypothetical protein
MLTVGAVFAAGLAAAGCVEEPTALKAAQLRTVLSGNTIYIANQDGSRQTAYLHDDGTAALSSDGATRAAHWRIVGDTICHDFRPLLKCYRVLEVKTEEREVPFYWTQAIDGGWQPYWDIKAGNPEKL